MRHAKAAWPDVPDHQRPLAERGRREAGLAGDWLREQFESIGAVLCSTATRTRQTLEATGLSAPVTFLDEIYEASPGELLGAINRHAPAGAQTVLLVGHAPGIPSLAAMLADQASDPATVGQLRSYPTSTISVLTAHQAWGALEVGQATLTQVFTAR